MTIHGKTQEPQPRTVSVKICTPLKSDIYFRFILDTRGVEATTFLSRTQNLKSKIRILFPVLLTTEYKVNADQFELCSDFATIRGKKWQLQWQNSQNRNRTPLK